MIRKFAQLAFTALVLCAVGANAQSKLSPKWEELTAADFRDAISQAKGACILPFGILEKHGPHLPLGTDLLNVRYASLHAVATEFAVVFPEYYFGQIFEAKHESGGDQAHIKLPEDVYTGIWWYGRFPDHYSGDGSVARAELGQWNLDGWVASIVEALRAVKADDASLRLQNEFYEKAKHPLDTKQ